MFGVNGILSHSYSISNINSCKCWTSTVPMFGVNGILSHLYSISNINSCKCSAASDLGLYGWPRPHLRDVMPNGLIHLMGKKEIVLK